MAEIKQVDLRRRFADLYCGIGGGTAGFVKAGYVPVFACDNNPICRKIYAENYHIAPESDIDKIEWKKIPHPEIIFASPPTKDVDTASLFSKLIDICDTVSPKAFLFEFPIRLMKSSEIDEVNRYEIGNYKCWYKILNAKYYNVPMHREYVYIVGIRKDVKTYFQTFPWASPNRTLKTVKDFLTIDNDPKLLIAKEIVERRSNLNIRNAKANTRFKHRVYQEFETPPSLPLRYYVDCRNIWVDSGTGPRRLSVLEGKRMLGFNDNYWLETKNWSNALRLLAPASPPPLIYSIAKELKDWLYVEGNTF